MKIIECKKGAIKTIRNNAVVSDFAAYVSSYRESKLLGSFNGSYPGNAIFENGSLTLVK
jgi:hypothetical protein